MISLNQVSKSFGPFQALAPLDLNVETGKNTVLIGPSGCGKSTLLRLMVGLLQPDSGHITFAGERITQENLLRLRRKIGYVIQDGGLFPHLTARDNALLLGRHLNKDEGELEKRLYELSELTKLPKDFLGRFPVQLSGGQRQRVSLIRALMLDPDLLVLDEPMGALDPMIRSELQEDLKGIFQRLNKTVVLVTHDLGEAFFFGHRIILMQGGKVIQQGRCEDLIKNPASDFVKQFVNAQRSPLEGLREMET